MHNLVISIIYFLLCKLYSTMVAWTHGRAQYNNMEYYPWMILSGSLQGFALLFHIVPFHLLHHLTKMTPHYLLKNQHLQIDPCHPAIQNRMLISVVLSSLSNLSLTVSEASIKWHTCKPKYKREMQIHHCQISQIHNELPFTALRLINKQYTVFIPETKGNELSMYF